MVKFLQHKHIEEKMVTTLKGIKIIPLKDIAKLYEQRKDAYPGLAPENHSQEDMINKLEEIQRTHPYPFYGYYEDEELLGSMRLFDFTMNLYGKKKLVGGLASVAVHLLHKKEKFAKKLVDFFLQYYEEKGASFTFLYSFRPDFYRKMGFGYGTRIYDYKVSPTSFPQGDSKRHLKFLDKEEIHRLVTCHNLLVDKIHGMIKKSQDDFSFYLEDPNKKIVIYEKDDNVLGYIIFSPKNVHEQNPLLTNFIIHEWVYLNKDALAEFTTFLHSQSDQFHQIVFQTQDENFFYLLRDPRSEKKSLIPPLFHPSHTTGIGMMTKVINPIKAIEEIQHREFGKETLTVQFILEDSFINKQWKICISFKNGNCSISTEKAEVHIHMDIGDYSSLLFGSISFKSLYSLGLISLSSQEYEKVLIRLFEVREIPICTVSF